MNRKQRRHLGKNQSMRSRERRTIGLRREDITIRSRDQRTGLPTEFSARVLNYNVVDDYLTRFTPGVFDASMAIRMPRVVWAHDWTNPIGQWREIIQNDEEQLELLASLANFEAVPDAYRAAALLEDGTVDQFSVGFYRTADQEAGDEFPGVYDITEGELIEASPVLVGAVPGTALTGMRAADDENHALAGSILAAPVVERIILSMYNGDLDLVEALTSLRAEAVSAEEAEMVAELDDALGDREHDPDAGDDEPAAEDDDDEPAAEIDELPEPDADELDDDDDEVDPAAADAEADDEDDAVDVSDILGELDDVLGSFSL